MASGCPAATSGDDPVGGGEGNQESRERERCSRGGVLHLGIWAEPREECCGVVQQQRSVWTKLRFRSGEN